jgi:cyclopropane fatty-acyl-phospholipid synthase-like methyltransferase
MFRCLLTSSEQMLLAAYALAGRNQLAYTEPQRIDHLNEFGRFFFGMYKADWEEALPGLIADELAQVQGENLCLTASGAARAAKLQEIHSRHLYAYNEFFYRARRSLAHSRFCEKVYGRNLCQHGMADLAQLDDLVYELRKDKVRHILELGCGNGAIAAYISSMTGAMVTGVDIAEEGIAWANAISDPRFLSFRTADMAVVQFPPDTFDALVIIDAIYFIHDLPAFINRILSWLRPEGSLNIFYSAWVDNDDNRSWLKADTTFLAESLRSLSLAYEIYDYSPSESEHWRLKLLVAEEMKPEFEAEGNAWLQQRRWIEAEGHRPYVENNNVSRFLYRVRKCNHDTIHGEEDG